MIENSADHLEKNAIKILIGNKSDLQLKREVTYDIGKLVGEKLKCFEYYEVSA